MVLHAHGCRSLAWCCGVMLALLGGPLQAAQDGLATALRAALANHPAVAGKQAEVQASDLGLSEARSQRLPSVSVQASHYTADNRSALTGDDLSNPVTFRLRQPLWTFGRIGSEVAAAEAGLKREGADLFRVRRELLTETALVYAEVLGARAAVVVAERNLEQLETLREQIQRRAEGQLASEADTRLAQTRLAQGHILLSRYRGEVDIALDALQYLTRVPLPATQPVPEGLLVLPDAAIHEQQMLDNSAELRLREEEVQLARADVSRSRAAAMPTVYLQAEKFLDQPGLRDDNQVSVVIEAGLDGLGFSTHYRSGAASARESAAGHDLQVTRLQLQRDARRLRQLHDLQQDLVVAQRATVTDLESLLDSYQRQYESGSKSWLDVLNIQRELNDQRLQLARAESDRLRYRLELLALSGGLDNLAGLANSP